MRTLKIILPVCPECEVKPLVAHRDEIICRDCGLVMKLEFHSGSTDKTCVVLEHPVEVEPIFHGDKHVGYMLPEIPPIPPKEDSNRLDARHECSHSNCDADAEFVAHDGFGRMFFVCRYHYTTPTCNEDFK